MNLYEVLKLNKKINKILNEEEIQQKLFKTGTDLDNILMIDFDSMPWSEKQTTLFKILNEIKETCCEKFYSKGSNNEIEFELYLNDRGLRLKSNILKFLEVYGKFNKVWFPPIIKEKTENIIYFYLDTNSD